MLRLEHSPHVFAGASLADQNPACKDSKTPQNPARKGFTPRFHQWANVVGSRFERQTSTLRRWWKGLRISSENGRSPVSHQSAGGRALKLGSVDRSGFRRIRRSRTTWRFGLRLLLGGRFLFRGGFLLRASLLLGGHRRFWGVFHLLHIGIGSFLGRAQ